ncbi:MAG TPA: helix-turn-helix domain-containing protein [Rhodocyclaceae bacterium]|nr:helix-turn-helix domain-containing protein [Rhodocyclaceae bacterium]
MSELSELQQSAEPAVQAELLAPPAAAAAPTSPGACLREAREARGLSIDEVTQAIKFSARQIEAIERDDFGRLPGSTFVRGIIRSYAKLLQIDAEPLLAMLGKERPAADSGVHAPEDTGAQLPLPGERRSLVPMLALLLTLAAVAVAVATHFNWPAGGRGAGEPKPAPASVIPGQLAQPALQVEQPASVAPAVAAATPAADSRQLIFVFQDKSWVEVKDATQKTIFSQNNLGGTRQVVSGKPPFDVVIGNASAVQLQYGDRTIDLRPYTKVEVARLTLQ